MRRRFGIAARNRLSVRGNGDGRAGSNALAVAANGASSVGNRCAGRSDPVCGARAHHRRRRAIAALEAAVSLYSSAFAVATVRCENARVTAALTPSFLAMVARALIRRGEYVAVLDATPGRGLDICPAATWDVRGGPAETDWWYRCDLAGPSGTIARLAPSDGVIHVRYAVDPARAWRGLSPLEWARATGTLAGNLEHRLGEEAGAPVGSYLPMPRADETTLTILTIRWPIFGLIFARRAARKFWSKPWRRRLAKGAVARL